VLEKEDQRIRGVREAAARHQVRVPRVRRPPSTASLRDGADEASAGKSSL
jgi:hypothetical protein